MISGLASLEISAISKQITLSNNFSSYSQAFFQGKLKIAGNMGLAMKLQNLQLQPGKAKLWRTSCAYLGKSRWDLQIYIHVFHCQNLDWNQALANSMRFVFKWVWPVLFFLSSGWIEPDGILLLCWIAYNCALQS